MKTKTMIIATMLLTAVSLSAKQYPDSVRQASAEEPNIAYGWNFEFEGGLGVGTRLQEGKPEHCAEENLEAAEDYPARFFCMQA